MSGKGDDRRRRRHLSDEDRELWGFVARSVGPARGKSRVRDVEPDFEALTSDFEAYHRRPPAREPAVPKPAPPPRPAAAPAKAATPPPPQPVPLDRRKARRIARGSEEIEARLDLHGMTQDDAHAALVGFIRRCSGEGLRTVLVITGKGGAARPAHDDHDVIPRQRGVLKRNVPRWLTAQELALLVISYTTAHVRHGGEGAIYVRLRKKG